MKTRLLSLMVLVSLCTHAQSTFQHELLLGLLSTEPNLGFESFAEDEVSHSLSFVNSITYKLAIKEKFKLRARLDRIDNRFKSMEGGESLSTESVGYELGLGGEVNLKIVNKLRVLSGIEFVSRNTQQFFTSDNSASFSMKEYDRNSEGVNLFFGLQYAMSDKLSVVFESAFAKMKTMAESTDNSGMKKIDRENYFVPVNMLAFQIRL